MAAAPPGPATPQAPARSVASGRPISTRGRFGVVVPSTNTVVEHDLHRVAPAGITFHTGRMYLADPAMGSQDDFLRLIEQIRASIRTAIRDVVTCLPDRMLMGMSAETFWDGVEGNAAFERRVHDACGLPVTTGASAVRAALEALGVRRVAAFSPYQPVADEQVGRYLTEAGFEVAAVTGLRCATATAIAEVGEDRLVEVVRELDADDVDAIVQVGTNLSFLTLADACERWLGKPVVAINAATLWHALRDHGIEDRFEGVGSLLRGH
jgi:maleate isomerase